MIKPPEQIPWSKRSTLEKMVIIGLMVVGMIVVAIKLWGLLEAAE